MGAALSRFVAPAKAISLGLASCFGVGAVLFVVKKIISNQETMELMKSSSFKVDEGKAESVYDNWAAKYDEETDDIGFASPWACAKATMAVVSNGNRILDIGCGTGLVGKLCLDLGFKGGSMDGTDISQEMMNVLASKGRTNIYKVCKKHDLSVVPWPFQTKAYDCTLCNGVLIYVEKPAVLEEFVRVTKKGGHCCIMFRNDGYPVYQAYDKQLRAQGKWKLVSQTEPTKNFPKAAKGSPSDKVTFSIYTYQVLV